MILTTQTIHNYHSDTIITWKIAQTHTALPVSCSQTRTAAAVRALRNHCNHRTTNRPQKLFSRHRQLSPIYKHVLTFTVAASKYDLIKSVD